MNTKNHKLICILGPTAGGKTNFAAQLALRIDAEIISADSRQVYRKMDIGTGKDLSDYCVDGKNIPYHLIDIADPGYEYNVFEFQKDFSAAFNNIVDRRKIPILCGGTGLYIESVLNAYKLINVPLNQSLRDNLLTKSIDELREILKTYKNLHNHTDTTHLKRLIRAIEIEDYYKHNPDIDDSFPEFEYKILGIRYDRESQRRRITERLDYRLKNGMPEEVKSLLESGVEAEKLIFYGLEYKFLTWYVTGIIDYDTMFQKLNTAIHQFAKRQMTWYRKMERNGFTINWLDGHASMDEKLNRSLEVINSQ